PALAGLGLDETRGQRQSLFERLATRAPDAVLTLDQQYRMCGPISDLVSESFYDGRLRPGSPAVAARRLTDLLDRAGATLPEAPFPRAVFDPSHPVIVVDTSADEAARDTVTEQSRDDV